MIKICTHNYIIIKELGIKINEGAYNDLLNEYTDGDDG